MANFTLLKELVQPAKTKIVMLVLDGVGGLPNADDQTELEAAHTPNLDRLAREGCLGQHYPVEVGITPGSGPGHLGLFGYDPVKYEIGRGVLEAVGIGLPLSEDDVFARGNFCTLDAAGNISDRRAGRIPTETCVKLVNKIKAANIQVADDVEVTIEPVLDYRFVLGMRGKGLSSNLGETDPQRTGVPPMQVEAGDAASQRTADLFNAWIKAATEVIKNDAPANGLTLRGRETFERVTALARERLAANPRSGPARASLGDALEQLGRLMVRQDDRRAARAPLQESLAIARGLAALQPDDAAMQRTFSRRLIYTTTVLLDLNRASPELIEEAIVAARADVRGSPNDAEAKSTLAAILSADASRMERSGEMTEARAAWYEVIQLRRALVASTSDDPQRDHAGDLATAWERIARLNLQTDDLQNALGAYNEAIRARRAALNGDAENRLRRAALADTLHATALARLQGEYTTSARTAFDEAARLRIALAEEVASDDAIAFAAVESLSQLAQINATENPEAAERNLEAGRTILDRVAEASPNSRGRVARYRATLARIAQRLTAAETAEATPTQ